MLTVTDVLRRFTGDPGLNPPSRIHRHCWTNDKYSMGTCSYPTVETEDFDFDCLSNPLPCEADPRLLFAGEATHGQFWGQMLGARLSGIREAQRVLDRLSAIERIENEMQKISLTKQSFTKHLNEDVSSSSSKSNGWLRK